MLENLYERHLRRSSLVKNAWSLERKSNISVFLKRSCTSKSPSSMESKCSFEHNSAKKRKGKGERSRSPAPRGNSSGRQSATRTGRSPSRKDDRPACFDYKSGACSRGRDCDYWHPPRCRHFKSNRCSVGKDCPLVLSQKEDRPRSPRRTSRRNTFCEKDQQLQSQMLQWSDLDI